MIYTKKGDKGETSLIGGTRVKKYDIRVQTYGEIDQLVSLLGFTATFLTGMEEQSELFVIQNKLFIIESLVACEDEQSRNQLVQITENDVKYLERKIDTMTTELPTLKGFIIPSSSRTATLLHVCRTQTRRCERLLIECNETYPQDAISMQYLNRLSDYLFTLAREVMRRKHRLEKYFQHTKRE